MEKLPWFERQFRFGLSPGMLPFLVERLEGTIVRLRSKVNDVSEELLSNMLDGKWSVKQNVGHLAEVEEISGKRISEMINGVSILSPAVFEPRGDYNKQPIRKVIDTFEKHRRENTKRVLSLTSDELSRSSMHPRLKVSMTPVDLAWFDAEHDDHHLVRINEILKTLLK